MLLSAIPRVNHAELEREFTDEHEFVNGYILCIWRRRLTVPKAPRPVPVKKARGRGKLAPSDRDEARRKYGI